MTSDAERERKELRRDIERLESEKHAQLAQLANMRHRIGALEKDHLDKTQVRMRFVIDEMHAIFQNKGLVAKTGVHVMQIAVDRITELEDALSKMIVACREAEERADDWRDNYGDRT